MGNDGGSIPTRRELVKASAAPPTSTELKETFTEKAEWAWNHCPLSHKPLCSPIVSDCAGTLYNKDAVLEFLLPGAATFAGAGALATDVKESKEMAEREEVLGGRVKALKDIVEVKFEVEAGEETGGRSRWVCPITRKQLGAKAKGVYLVPCGHAFSEIAIKEVKGDACLQCNEPYTETNIISILPTSQEDVERLILRVQRLREQGLTHSLRKGNSLGKRRKKHAAESIERARDTVDNEITDSDTSKRVTVEAHVSIKIKPPPPTAATTSLPQIKNAATASLTAKVLHEEERRKKRQKTGMNDNIKGLFSTGGEKGKSSDFMTRGFSIPAGARR